MNIIILIKYFNSSEIEVHVAKKKRGSNDSGISSSEKLETVMGKDLPDGSQPPTTADAGHPNQHPSDGTGPQLATATDTAARANRAHNGTASPVSAINETFVLENHKADKPKRVSLFLFKFYCRGVLEKTF